MNAETARLSVPAPITGPAASRPVWSRVEQRRRVLPEIETGLVVNLLPPGEVVGLAVVREAELVDHQLEPRRLACAEQVEDPGARRDGAAERRKIDGAAERAEVVRIGEEPVEVADHHGRMHGELGPGPLALTPPGLGIGLAEDEAPHHRLAKRKADGLVTHGVPLGKTPADGDSFN